MGTIRAGGLASGIDANGIIDKLVEKSKEPIFKLQDMNYLNKLEKTLYKDVNTSLTSMKSSLLDLRLEKTFKSKSVMSSSNILRAEASERAKSGIYTLDVLETARNSFVTSRYLSTLIYTPGAGVINMQSKSAMPYSQQEGLTTVGIIQSEVNSDTFIANAVMEPDNGRKYKTALGDNIKSTFMDNKGNVTVTGTNAIAFKINIPGKGTLETEDIVLELGGSAGIKDINDLNNSIEQSLNARINAHMETNFEQYVAVRAIYDDSSQTWKQAIYYTNDSGITVSAENGKHGNPAITGTLADDLGLSGTYKDSVESTIAKFVVGSSLEELGNKLKDERAGIVSGVGVMLDEGGLKKGAFQIHQDSSMNVKRTSKTRIMSNYIELNQPGSGSALNQNLSAAGFASSNVNGIIEINGVSVDLTDTENRTINDIMGIINSSGTGATMRYDNYSKSFVLENNKNGGQDLTIQAKGTSEFIKVFGLDVQQGAVKHRGNTGGQLNVSAPVGDLEKSGFTFSSTSGVFTINNVPIYVDTKKDSVNDIIRKVNNSAADVTLIYDEKTDKFTMQSKNVKPILIGSPTDTSNIMNVFGLTPKHLVPLTVGEAGTQAVIRVDGTTYRRDSNKITDIIPGLELNLSGKGTAVIDVKVNTEPSVDALARFIRDYNTLNSKLRPSAITNQERKDKMAALSEEKRKSMKDEELKKYMQEYDRLNTNDKIMKSREMQGVKYSLRENIMNPMDSNRSKFKSLSDIGIKIFGGHNIAETKHGYLVTRSQDLDEIKKELMSNEELLKNLRDNSDEVFEFFGGYNESYKKSTDDPSGTKRKIPADDYRESWARRYENMLTGMMSDTGSIGKNNKPTGSPIDERIKSIDKQIERITDRTESELKKLWQDFSAMEKRIAEINKQGQALAKIGGQQPQGK